MKEECVKPQTIWTIFLCEKLEPKIYESGKDSGFNDRGCSAAMGFYLDKEDAVEAMHNNVCDIRECVYNYGCIEEVGEGVYGAIPNSVQWFKWNEDKQGYYEIETPEREKHIYGYCL